MKKIYIAIAAVLLAAASVATAFAVCSHNRMDDFFRANVDALTDQENAVSIPCVQSTSICYFVAEDANGKKYSAEVTGFRNK